MKKRGCPLLVCGLGRNWRLQIVRWWHWYGYHTDDRPLFGFPRISWGRALVVWPVVLSVFRSSDWLLDMMREEAG